MNFVPRFRALAIAALSTASLPALATAQTVTVSDIAFETGSGLKVSIPTLEATGASLDEAGIRRLFEGGLTEASRMLADFDAQSVRIPELIITTSPPAGNAAGAAADAMTTSTTYRDFVLTDIADGRARSSRLAGAEMTGADQTAVSIGAMSTDLIDLGAIIGFYGYGEPSDEMRQVYANFVMDGMRFSAPEFSCTIGRATGADVRARPMKHTIEDLTQWIGELETAETTGETPSPDALKAVIGYYVDMLTALESAPTEVAGFDCGGADTTGAQVSVTSGPLTIGGFRSGIYPDIALSEMRIDVPQEGWIALGKVLWKEMDLRGPIALLEANLDNLTEDWFETNWRQLIPAFAGFSIDGLALDVPTDDAEMPRVAASIGHFDVTLADYVNGIPAAIASAGRDISLPLPPEAAPVLDILGIETLNFGHDIAARWDSASSTVLVESFGVSAERLGTLNLSGTIGNAGPDLFADDNDAALAAAMGLTVKDITITIDNGGFLPALIALGAHEEGQPPQAVHAMLVGMAQAMPFALLGATPEAQRLGTELAAFLNGAPNLKVTLTAVDPAGIGLPEFLAAEENPTLLQGKFTVAAETSGESVPLVFPDVSTLPAPTPNPAPEADALPDEAPPIVSAPLAPEPSSRAIDKAGSKQ